MRRTRTLVVFLLLALLVLGTVAAGETLLRHDAGRRPRDDGQGTTYTLRNTRWGYLR